MFVWNLYTRSYIVGSISLYLIADSAPNQTPFHLCTSTLLIPDARELTNLGQGYIYFACLVLNTKRVGKPIHRIWELDKIKHGIWETRKKSPGILDICICRDSGIAQVNVQDAGFCFLIFGENLKKLINQIKIQMHLDMIVLTIKGLCDSRSAPPSRPCRKKNQRT